MSETARERLLKGHTLRVETLAGRVVTFGSGIPYVVGPPARGHEHHAALAPGHILVVAKDSAPNGDTLVTLPCKCDLLLLANETETLP